MSDKSLSPLDIPELRVPCVFRRRPVAIPADLRPIWRIGLLILLLKRCCRGGRTSLARLHVLSWGFRSPDGRDELKAVIEGHRSPDSLVVRFEPFLVQAVDFALGEGIIRRIGGNRIELTDSGRAFAEEIETADSIFVEEKKFIAIIRTKLSEKMVSKMFE